MLVLQYIAPETFNFLEIFRYSCHNFTGFY